MKREIKVPSVGESIQTGEIGTWEKPNGSFVKKGDVLVILETDKASMEIPAEQDGQLEIVKQNGEVQVDEVIAFINTDVKFQKEPDTNESLDKKTPLKNPASKKQEEAHLSPAVKHLIGRHNIDASHVKGTGKGGRLLKEDILKALNETQDGSASSQVSKPASHQDLKDSQLSEMFKEKTPIKKDQTREPMTRLRKITAKRLVQSQRETASLSTFNEVNLSRIIEIRKKYQKSFVEKYGFKLGFMSFFVKSVVLALKKYPKLNAFIEEEDIIYNSHQHVGVAISTDKGLVVPVLFHAETLSLAQIEKQILNYRDKALEKKLSPDDLLGGTFTISNGGVFGSLLSAPILNPPQSGILGMHKIEERPIALNGEVKIRPMMYLALSYDHRIVDGRDSVGFLVKVKECLEEPSRLLIDI